MNQQDKIELSKRVAEKYGVEPWIDTTPNEARHTLLFLAEDGERCFGLAVNNNLDVVCNNELVVEVFSLTDNFISTVEKYADHPSAYAATRIAILKCLDAMKGE